MSKENNFDFLRLLFATFVIITHSYPLTGNIEKDVLMQITNSDVALSYLGVRGFFAISGFLIYTSALYSKSILGYFWRRFLRLFPGLFVALVITVIFLPLVYDSSVPYLRHRGVRYYVPNNMTLYNVQYSITGVFSQNPYKGVINGSLWTLAQEFTLYVLFGMFYFLKNRNYVRKITLVALILFITLINLQIFEVQHLNILLRKFNLNPELFFNLASYFSVGALIAEFKIHKNKYAKILLIVSFIFFILSLFFDFFNQTGFVSWSFTVILLGNMSFYPINQIHKVGDFSYGLYIYAFPIQQFLMYFYTLSPLQLMISSFFITLFFAIMSWFFVEKKALQLKSWVK